MVGVCAIFLELANADPGLFYAVSNMLATVPGIVVPIAAAALLRRFSTHSGWVAVFGIGLVVVSPAAAAFVYTFYGADIAPRKSIDRASSLADPLLDALDEAPRQIVLIGERNPMRAKGKVARTRRRRASELAGTDYDGALKFLQGLGYATKAPARTVRGRRYVHRSGARITLLRVEGTPGYLVEFALLGDDEASLLELRESLPLRALD